MSVVDTFLEPLALSLGFPTDQLKFVICHLISYPLGYLYRKISPGESRHIYSIVIGSLFLYVCFGVVGMVNFFLIGILMYTLFNYLPPQQLPKASFIIMFSYLSSLHIYRMVTDYMGWTMDVTAAIMVITIKITTLACNYSDGQLPEETLWPTWKKFSIKTLPTLLEYFSYLCFFPTFLSGPSFHIKPYLSWINGQLYKDPKHNPDGHMPDPTRPVLESLGTAVVCLVVFMVLTLNFPLEPLYQPHGLDGKSIIYYHLVLFLGAMGVRCQYYFIWKLAEGAGILSGLGFSEYTNDGKPVWTRLTNVFLWKIETFGCLRDITTYWNYKTGEWLKNYVYFKQTSDPSNSKVPWYGLYLTNSLSAFWHGFYPGYYVAFVYAAITVDIARRIRGIFRPMVTVMKEGKEEKIYPQYYVYDILGRIITVWTFNFGFAAFIGLSLERTWNVYVNLGFSGYILALFGWIAIMILEPILKKKRI